MRKFLTFIFLFVTLLTTNSFAQKPKSKPKPKPKPTAPAAQVKVDLGKLSGNTYANEFFGLKFDFPLGWLVGDNVLEKQLKEISETQLQTKTAGQQKAVKQALVRVTPLLGGYKKLPGMPENASLRVMVEDLLPLPQIKNGKDYLTHTLGALQVLKMPADFKVSEIKSETVDNVPFDYLDVSLGDAKKRIYAVVKGNFALFITIDYYENADFEALRKILTEADLNYKK